MNQKRIKNHQKTPPKNTPKKQRPHFNQKCAQGDQNTTDKGGKGRDPGWNPPRKKKNIAKTKLTAGKGCMREGNTQTVTELQHAPRAGCALARGRIFRCFLVPFRRPFGQCWALLAPFGPFWGPCWALLAPFWNFLDAPG